MKLPSKLVPLFVTMKLIVLGPIASIYSLRDELLDGIVTDREVIG